MTTTAIAEGYKICQAFLGLKIRHPKHPAVDLPTMLVQVVGSVFSLMEEYQSVWQSVKGSVPTPVFGSQPELDVGPAPVSVQRIVSGFKQGLRDLLPIWEIILAPDTLAELLPLGLATEEFHFPSELWVRVIYDFALAYHERALHREHLLKALTPLYLGWTASFILETERHTAAQVDEVIERLARQYEVTKPYLTARWR